MINSIRTELQDYKITLSSGRFNIELEYTLEAGSSPNFRRSGRITLIFYKHESFTSHFLRYSDTRFIESFKIFIDPDKYHSVVDLLRNESPVYFYGRIDYRGRGAIPDGRHEVSKFSLSTDKEQIGEDDLDEST